MVAFGRMPLLLDINGINYDDDHEDDGELRRNSWKFIPDSQIERGQFTTSSVLVVVVVIDLVWAKNGIKRSSMGLTRWASLRA